jgi:hypothetical protein
MPHPALPTSVAELDTTAGLLTKAISLLDGRALYTDYPGFTSDDGQQIDVPTAILLAHTGAQQPPAHLGQHAVAHIPVTDTEFYQHPPVGQAIRFLSICIDHDGAIDANGEADYLDHVAWWTANKTYSTVTGELGPVVPYEQVIATMRDAAQHAADLAQQLQLATAA